jgi:hypothetical protein
VRNVAGSASYDEKRVAKIGTNAPIIANGFSRALRRTGQSRQDAAQRPPRPASVLRQVSYRAAPPCAINQRLKPLELLEVWQQCAYLRIVERRRDGVKGD